MFTEIKSVAVVIQNREEPDKVLAVSRKYDLTQFGLPGGKVDSGEEPYEAAHREIFEETGFKLSGLKLILIDYDKSPRYNYYCAAYLAAYDKDQLAYNIPEMNNEGCAVKWATWEEIFSGPFGEYNKQVYALLQKEDALSTSI